MTKPFFKYDEDNMKSRITQRDTTFLVSLNYDSAVNLERGLHGLAYKYPYYEEVDIWPSGFADTPDENNIGLCEITLIKDEDVEAYSLKGLVRHDCQIDRLDIYATRERVQAAYKTISVLNKMSKKNYFEKSMLFDNVFVQLIDG